MKAAASAAALAAALGAGPWARAQDVKDFQLPPGTPSPAPGPTDSNVPAPTPQPTPRPSPPPVVAIPRPTPSPAATPSPRATPRPAAPVASRPAAALPRAAVAPPAAPPTPAVTASAAPIASEPAPEATAAIAPSEAAAAAPAARPQAFPDWLIWLAAGAGALLLAFGGFLLGRRSRPGAPDDDGYAEAEAYTPPPSPPPPAAQPAAAMPEAAPPPAPQPLPSPIFARPFDLVLEPQRMTLALINASLTYRLSIVNRDDRPLGPLRITCDLISAHASLQAAEQLVPDPTKAWLSHDFETLPPGESLVVNGEVRLPRAEILPVRSGNGHIFVPLARFTVQTLDKGRPETVGARVFVIGEEPEQPGAALKPFRLDEGTRSYSRVGQREVTIAS